MPDEDAPDEDAKDAEEIRRQFREALDRKRHKGSSGGAGAGDEQSGKVHDAHGPAKTQRTFRRKSGG